MFKGGVHSGFNVGSIIFNTGAELHYLPHSGTLQRNEKDMFHRFVEEVKIHETISLGRNTALLTIHGFLPMMYWLQMLVFITTLKLQLNPLQS